MSALKVLFIGGSGLISSACVGVALDAGMELTLLNRGQTSLREVPVDAKQVVGDVRDPETLGRVVGSGDFDVVVDFIAFTTDQVSLDIEVASGKVGQYVFISSASAYGKPVRQLPITESTPLRNPYWEYSRNKIACEDLLVSHFRDHAFPATIVRPSHTYDRTSIPLDGGWTVIDRMRRGKPVVVPGDGTSLWVLTHHRDFARAFVPLLGDQRTIGDSFHITSDEVLTWNQIYSELGHAAGVEPQLVHVASEAIARAIPTIAPGLLGDKSHSVIFDNEKVRRIAAGWHAVIPFAAGAREMIEWRDGDPSRRAVDEVLDHAFEVLVAEHG
ncbi:MAG TPA: SDR family oxidoreductase [Acidimicrobiales bacterium]|nr:SDR family oxidoreductase [Acidimicrobiales bacterium]